MGTGVGPALAQGSGVAGRGLSLGGSGVAASGGGASAPVANEESITAVTMNYNTWSPAFDVPREYLWFARRSAAVAGTARVYDISDPTSPSQIGDTSLGTDRGFAAGYDRVNQRFYAVNSVGDTFVGYDAADPAALTSLGSRDWGVAGQGARTEMYDDGDTLCTNGDNQLRILDVSTPSGTYPIVGSLDLGWDRMMQNKIDENRIALFEDDTANIAVVNLANQAAPAATWNRSDTGKATGTSVRQSGVTTAGLWVPIGSNQYRLLDFTDGDTIDTFTSPLTDGSATLILATDRRGLDATPTKLVIANEEQFVVADVSNPADPVYSDVVDWSSTLYIGEAHMEVSEELGLFVLAGIQSVGASSSAGHFAVGSWA